MKLVKNYRTYKSFYRIIISDDDTYFSIHLERRKTLYIDEDRITVLLHAQMSKYHAAVEQQYESIKNLINGIFMERGMGMSIEQQYDDNNTKNEILKIIDSCFDFAN